METEILWRLKKENRVKLHTYYMNHVSISSQNMAHKNARSCKSFNDFHLHSNYHVNYLQSSSRLYLLIKISD